MDLELNEQQKLFKNAIQDIVDKGVNPFLSEFPEDEPLPKEAILHFLKMMSKAGLMGARVPAEAGGAGLDYISVGLLYETLPPEAGFMLAGNDIQCQRIYYGSTEQVRKRFLPPLLAGEIMGGSAISEPNVGSDPRGIQTKAVKKDGHYLLNGTKIWSSHGSIADVLLTIAAVEEGGSRSLARFLVERRVSPYTANDIPTLGLRRHHLCEVVFQDCKVPAENMVGEPGDAHGVLTLSWLCQRVIIALHCVHLMQHALDYSIAYAKQRKQFGRAIGGFQLVQNMIVEIAALTETSRLLCYKALSLLEKGQWAAKECSMAKFYATESVVRALSMAIEVHGAYGITRQYLLERMFRDARMLAFPDGTPEIQRLIVGKELLGIRAFT